MVLHKLQTLAALAGCLLSLILSARSTSLFAQRPFAFQSHVEQTQVVAHTRPSVEVFAHIAFEGYRLRIAKPKLCDASVKQYSGYLDISETKHLFFWFFEARNSPENAPLMLWLNGGPGASTIASGLLFENGPCSFSSTDNGTIRNDHSWNEKLNIIYLEEPVGTGYSYTTDDTTVDTLSDLATDVYAFLQLFMHRFPKYESVPFHVAAESWGGHYGPHVARRIFDKNSEFEYAPFPGQVKINLESLILANGLTEPASQFESMHDYMCKYAPYPPYARDDPRCVGLKLGSPACIPMIHACYRFPTKAVCNAATIYCWSTHMVAPFEGLGKNFYDLRKDCNRDEHPLCYEDIDRIAVWLNETETKIALGVDADYDYQVVNTTVQTGFYYQGQAMMNSAALLPDMVRGGVRLMAYAGDTDVICNYMGVERWMSRLQHVFHEEFKRSPSKPWTTSESGYHAGTVRTAGAGAGNVTFVRIFDAGHMAPHDQPEATLDMITRWVDNVPLA